MGHPTAEPERSIFFCERLKPGQPLSDFGARGDADPFLDDANPFFTDNYVRAKRSLGFDCRLVGIRRGGVLAGAAPAILKRGRLGASLEIESLPAVAQDSVFWKGLYALCAELRVTDLYVGTFGSPSMEIPSLPGEISRAERREYVLHLAADDLPGALSTNHKRNVKKALSAGVSIRRSSNPEWLTEHLSLMGKSFERRNARGEPVSIDSNEARRTFSAFLESGAGELFQASLDGKVVSSLLLLRSPAGAYYQSAGTSPEGMKVGASPFLIYSAAQQLAGESVRIFNLGGAQPDTTLGRFKAGFGSVEIPLAECSCYVGPAWLKKIRTVVDLARNDKRALVRTLAGGGYRVRVFALPADASMPAIKVEDGLRFQELSLEDLRSTAFDSEDKEFRERQVKRLGQPGWRAYGVYAGDRLAHISWLIPADSSNLEQPQILQLRSCEMEITGCETLPPFRGKSLYSFAIRNIFQCAAAYGAGFIYMKTLAANKSSQRGILKAGLRPMGTVTVLTLPLFPGKQFVVRRLRPVNRVR